MAKLGKRGIARRLLQRYPKSRAEPLCQFLADCPLHSTRTAAESVRHAARMMFAHCRKAA
jgi:hypothetical protein